MKTRDIYPTGTGTGGPETDPIATAALKTLSDAVALLPTNATLAPIKSDITQLQTDIGTLASKADLATANTALAAVTAAVKKLETTGSPADLMALQTEIAKATADIAAIKTKQDEHALAVQKATQAIADLAIIVAGGAGANSAALTALQTRLANVETSKADKAQLDTLTQSVLALDTALKTVATDQEVADAIAAVDKTITDLETALKAADDALALKVKTNADNIAELQKKSGNVIRYTVDGDVSDLDHRAIIDGAIALKLPKSTLNRVIELDMLQSVSVPTLTADAGEQFFVFDGKTVVASTDGLGTLDQFYSQVFLIGRAAGGWDVVTGAGGGSSSSASTVETIILPLLPANVWTAIPTTKTITDWQVRTPSGSYITDSFQYRRTGVSLEVFSLSAFSDLQFTFEAAASGSSKQETVILSVLPANVWTAISSTKSVIDWQVESATGQVLTDSFEYRNIGGNLEVFSLVQFNNLQFILEEQ